MARRRTKKRTHKAPDADAVARIPKSMVLAVGESLKNHSISQLVKDFRFVMQPHTAISLRERKANKLKDFAAMSGPLGVSDLFVFKQNMETGNVSLRLGKMPRGPCMQFKVHEYSLIKDVQRMLRRPKSVSRDSDLFLEPPLLVMNGFTKIGEAENHEKLMITMFQNLFPAIQPHSTRVSGIKRVLMLNKGPDGHIVLRHYAIDTKLVEESRTVKKLIDSHHHRRSLPILSKKTDIADLVLDPYAAGGATSESEIEDDAVVEVKNEMAQRVRRKPGVDPSAASATEKPTRKRAIKLVELGPRIDMSLVKIQEAMIGSSKTIYHSLVKKTPQEVAELERKHNERMSEKAERRRLQKANVDAKLAKKAAKKEKKLAKKGKTSANEQDSGNKSDSDASDSGSDSDGPDLHPSDYENDSDLFSE